MTGSGAREHFRPSSSQSTRRMPLARTCRPAHDGLISLKTIPKRQQVARFKTLALTLLAFLISSWTLLTSPVQSAPSKLEPRQKRAATARLDRLWDDAVIPYEIDQIFSDERASLFRSAMRHWENSTCIKFVERIPEEHKNYIFFTERSCGCCSFVGKRGNGAQAISIGKHCDKFGIVVHELGHVVGFWHEHTRPDRDQHVQIIGKNIMAGQEYNFNKLTKEEVNSLGLAYDYDSILHYATNTFAKDTYLDTILPLHGHLNTEEASQAPPVSIQSTTSPTNTSNSTSPATGGPPLNSKQANLSGPSMINDESKQRINLARQQIEEDFQSMLQFDGKQSEPRKGKNNEVMLLDGSVLVGLLGTKDSKSNQHRIESLDVDDGEHMLSMDNMLAKTRPEIGQRVRLSVGDIAQTNLLYKCPKCGRTIQQTSGSFHSPGYHHINYERLRPKQANGDASSNGGFAQVDFCEWRLSVGQGERIMLNITDLDLASPLTHVKTTSKYGMPKVGLSDQDLHLIRGRLGTSLSRQDSMITSHCTSDYIEVRDGYTYRAPIIAKLCGHIASLRDVMRPIVSTSNRILVSYRTSSLSAHKRGFMAQFETICGGYIMLGNALYDSSIQISSGQPPIAQLKAMIESPSRAAVEVVGGLHQNLTSTTDNQRATINTSSPFENEVVLNSQVNTRYNSLQSHQAQLTHPNDSSQSKATATTETSTSTPTPENRVYSWSSWPALNTSVIQSPNWPENYRPSRECIWQIRAEDNHQIALRFDALDLESHDSCAYDYIEIRDGETMNSDLIGRFCGNQIPDQILSSGQSMLVKFVSDSDVSKGGFFANLRTELDECKLGTHGCSYKCSNAVAPYRCECPSGQELAADRKSCVPICGGMRNESTGRITSPLFPDLYPISTRCVWDIKAPAHHKITLNFTHFDLEGIKAQECDYDYVQIWSRTNDGEYIRNGLYCGPNQPFTVTSLADQMRIEFKSDNSIQKSGFEAKYSIDHDECATNNGGCQHICINNIGSYQCACNNGFTLHENKHDCVGSHCLFTITSPDGTFHSPNFPNLYQPNKECAWVFTTAPGHRVKLVFDQFDLESHQECAYDYVTVFDGEGVEDHALGRFCGSRRPLTLVSSFNILYLVFHSDATNEKRGFNATHSTICGGRLQANLNQYEYIYSHPLFDGITHYNRNEDCEWIIETNENQRIRIEFTFFSLEANANCNYDQAIVYDGIDDVAPQLARLCGTDLPKEQTKITSTGESMLIAFKSDDSINGRGFSLTYTAITTDP